MKAIKETLYIGRNRWQTTNEIAERSKLSWPTAREGLKELKKDDIIESDRKSGRTYWKVKS